MIEKYLDDVRRRVAEQGVNSYMALNPQDFHGITPRMFSRWHAILDRAEVLAENEQHKKMIAIARLPVQFTEACRVAPGPIGSG